MPTDAAQGRGFTQPDEIASALTAFIKALCPRQVGRLASGAATTSQYSRGVLRLLSRHGLRGRDPKEFAIH